MSKKMLKRSLALGALMAFVITGSAMAASVENGKEYIGKITDSELLGTGTETIYIVGTNKDANDNDISNNPSVLNGTEVKNIDQVIFKGDWGTGAGGAVNAVQAGKDSTIKFSNINHIGYVGDIDTSYPDTTVLFHAYGGKIVLENINSIDLAYGGSAFYARGYNGGVGTLSADVKGNINASSVFVMNKDSNANASVTLNAQNVTLDSSGRAIYVRGDNYTDKDFDTNATINATSDLIIKGNDNDGYGVICVWYGNASENVNSVDLSANNITIEHKNNGVAIENSYGSKINVKANNKVTIKGDINAWGSDGVDVAGSIVDITGSIYATGDKTILNINGGETTNITGSIYAMGCDEETDYDNDKNEVAKINVVGNNITIDGNGGQAVKVKSDYSGGDSTVVTIGDKDTTNVEIENASYGIYSQYYGSKVVVNGKQLDVTTKGADSVGIFAGNNDQFTGSNVETVSNVVVNSNNAKITVADGGYAGIWALSHGIVDIKNGLEIKADNAIVARGGAKVNIVGNGDVKIEGDIEFNNTGNSNDYLADADNVHTGVNADVNINLTTANSYLKGNIFATDRMDVRADSLMQYVKGMKLNLSNGAKWELSEASVVNQASFGKDTVLALKDGSIFEKQAEASKDVYALNAGGGTENKLTVANGAKLQIGGIKETTYNIATGFENYDAVEGWTEIADNALMEANKVIDQSNKTLQVEIKTKEAEQMATEMGISNSTAQSVANVTAAAQAAIDGGAVAKPEGTGNDKAVALVQAMANANPQAAGQAFEAVSKMAEAGGNSGTAASIVKNVTGVTNDRLSFNCGHSAPHKGGHGVGLFEEGSGADVWVEYVHGKDKVEDMPSTAGKTSYEGQYNGIVMGVDFKKVNKFQSGFAFNYGEGDTNSVGSAARTHSDYDFWGIGYYGSIHNDDSNVIFDIGYAKTDSDVETKALGMTYNASPETTTWTAGVKVEKLYQNENVQIVPYTGLRFMSIDPEDYSTECASSKYQMERQNVWLLPLGVSIKQEVTNDNGWTVSPRVDLSYIWAFGDTDSEMEFSTLGTKTNIGYEVMDDGSFLGLVGIEAHKGQWGFGVSYSYQKGDHSESKKWFVDANYSF